MSYRCHACAERHPTVAEARRCAGLEIRDGTLVAITDHPVGSPAGECRRCGHVIRTGTYCADCAALVQSSRPLARYSVAAALRAS
jgi:hypothetical protein